MIDRVFGNIGQQGYVVDDIDEALDEWSNAIDIGPWALIKNIGFSGSFRGASTSPILNIALAYNGDQQIEFIQQVNDDPSPYLANGRGWNGPHHIGYLYEKDEFDGACSEAVKGGMTLEYDVTSATGARYCYFSMKSMPRFYVELVELDDGSKAFFEELKRESITGERGELFQVLEF